VSSLLQDLRFAVRMLAKNPGFTTAAVLTIAIGIGANTALFSVVYGVLLRPLQFSDPARLVAIWESNPEAGQPRQRVSAPTFLDWRRNNRSFETVCAFHETSRVSTDTGFPEQLNGKAVSSGFFSMLGVQTLYGRTFTADEERAGNDKVVILDHGLWQRLFGGNANIIGKRITLSDERFEVVGILPEHFRYVEPADIWLPLSFSPDALGPGSRGARYLKVLARLRQDVAMVEANEDMNALARQLGEQYPNSTGWGVALNSLHDEVTGGHRTPLLVLFGAVGLVMLIACGNVANLLLSRAAVRGREVAVRAALGASRLRLTMQFLMEGLTLAFLGAVVGLLIASWTLNPLLCLAPMNIPRLDEVSLDTVVLVFMLCLTIMSAVFFGLAPVRHIAAEDLNAALKNRTDATPLERRRVSLRSLFVIAQVSLSLILLVGAGLLMRSFVQLLYIDPGFKPEGSMTLSFNLSGKRYPDHRQRAAFSRQLLDGVRSIPGVEGAGLGTNLPLGGSSMTFGFFLGDTPMAGEQIQFCQYHTASPDYFNTMGVPIIRGRDFTRSDDESGPQVAIVNRTLVQRYWPGKAPLGERIRTISQNGITAREIVGVVGDIKHSKLSAQAEPEVYVPYAQDSWPFPTLVVRNHADGQSLLSAVRRQVWAIDKTIPVAALESIDRRVDDSIASNRFQMQMLSLFAATAMFLAMVGLLAVVGYLVSRRTREIGIRKALGAQSIDVIRMVVGEGLLLSAIGIALGLLGAIGLMRWLASLLFEISPADPVTLAATCVLMLVVSFVASYIPARRAVRINPIEALRNE
jgi:putative ABC transport system permease protein